MLVGLISDTHDNLVMIDEVIKELNNKGVELVLHAGDYISPFVPPRFKSLNCKLIGVYGNNCAEREKLRKNFEAIGADIKGFFTVLELDGVKIALLHGHECELLDSVIASGAFNVVVHGHTHKQEVRRVDETLVINPGEVCGYLSGEATYALFETKGMKVEIGNID